VTLFHDIRREYGEETLDEKAVARDPFVQFRQWLAVAIQAQTGDPTAMVLSTVDENQMPDSRVVLLKELTHEGLVFYSNYLSSKGKQLEKIPYAAANFYWPDTVRQVKVRGRVEKVSAEESAHYFASRPFNSQVSVYASLQSQVLQNRQELDDKMNYFLKTLAGTDVPCPTHWGGYLLTPLEFEFFQGRSSRLHDRIRYRLVDEKWLIERLSP
jgi:pyridoxamine 5'-phosphate oxidase